MPLFNPAMDPDAAGQIDALASKTTPVGADEILIEDSAAGYAKKKLLVSNLPVDGTAIHKATAAEISALTEKTTPVAADVLVIEDSAASYAKKKLLVSNLPATVDTTAIHKATSAEISALAEKTTPASVDVVVIEDSAASYAKKKVQVGNLGPPASAIVEATGTITTTSASDVVATSMTTTPVAATYLVIFGGSITNGTGGEYTYASIWYNSAQVASSERVYYRSGNQQQHVPFCCIARVTANGSAAIEGRWRVSNAASTGSLYQRSLSIVKVS